MNSMKVLVTGSQGRIGTHLVKVLPEAGYITRGVDVKSGGDILADNFNQAIESYYPGAIIHLAGQTDVLESTRNPSWDAEQNIIGTLRVLEKARDIDAKVIVASSTVVYEPTTPYAISMKTAAEYAAVYHVLYGLDVVTLGISNVYGPGMGGVVGTFIADEAVTAKLADQGPGITIHGDGTQERDFIYVDDVVRALTEALTWDAGYFEVATGISTPIFEVFRALTFKWGYTPKRTNTLLPPFLQSSGIKLRCDLPWAPISLDDGLGLTLEEYRSRKD